MAALPSVKRFYAEDYKESPPWFQRFLSQLDLFTEPIYNILNQNVDVSANTDEEIYSFQVKSAGATPTSNAAVFAPQKFTGKPNGILIGQCIYNATTGVATAVGNPVTLDWIWTGSQVSILAIYGLTVGNSYSFSLRIY